MKEKTYSRDKYLRDREKIREKRFLKLKLSNPNYIPHHERTDFIYLKKQCRICFGTKNLLNNVGWSTEKRQYYICRKCNRDKQKKYYITEKGKKNVKRTIKKSNKKYPLKQIAREKLKIAVRNNTIMKPNICDMCNLRKQVSGHHSDYLKPLDVKWLCQNCHSLIHKRSRKIINQKYER